MPCVYISTAALTAIYSNQFLNSSFLPLKRAPWEQEWVPLPLAPQIERRALSTHGPKVPYLVDEHAGSMPALILLDPLACLHPTSPLLGEPKRNGIHWKAHDGCPYLPVLRLFVPTETTWDQKNVDMTMQTHRRWGRQVFILAYKAFLFITILCRSPELFFNSHSRLEDSRFLECATLHDT